MVRGLLIRQAFILLDIALAVLAVAMAGLVVKQLFNPMLGFEVAVENPRETQAQKVSLASIGDISTYSDIVLFGPAGDGLPVETPPEAPASDELPTELNLKLIGTISLTPKDPFATAFIEDLDAKGAGAQTYALDQEVVTKVKLAEVRPREVVLLNERNSPATREILKMDEPEEGENEAPAPVKEASAHTGSNGTVQLDRQEIIQDLYSNYADLVTKVKPKIYTDASGKVAGITADNIGEVPLAKKLGIEDGDVLQTVNNEQIDSEQKIMEMVQKYRNASSFRIGVLRNGKTQMITYRLN